MKFYKADYFKPVIRESHPNIFVFDLFPPALCESLLERIAKTPSEPPNSMNKYGADLDDLGLKRWASQLKSHFVAPVARDYYPECGKLGAPYGFVVQYERGKQRSLAAHIDEPSLVTLNVCLGREFVGGDLVFLGPRKERHVVKHAPGQAIIHRGHHLHRAEPIERGHRTNLILWCGK